MVVAHHRSFAVEHARVARIAARVHNNPFIQHWHGRENELRARLDDILPTYTEALQRGDRDIVPFLFGQSADFVHAVRPAADVLREAIAAISRDLSRLDGRPSPDALVGMGGAITNMAAV